MTDRERSVEVERLMRLEGCLGIFRVFGQSMEIFMGSVLAGDNAATPLPNDAKEFEYRRTWRLCGLACVREENCECYGRNRDSAMPFATLSV